MTSILRTLGLSAWVGCALVLAYQAIVWVLSASWPTPTLLDVFSGVFGLDLTSIINNLPLDIAARAIYLLITTELAIAMWWLGAFFFVLTFVCTLIFKK